MTNDADLRNQQLAALQEAHRAIERAMAILGGDPAPGLSPAVPAAEPEQWLQLKAAAKALGMNERTLKRQARVHGFGLRAAGSVWRIEMACARAWQARRPFRRVDKPT